MDAHGFFFGFFFLRFGPPPGPALLPSTGPTATARWLPSNPPAAFDGLQQLFVPPVLPCGMDNSCRCSGRGPGPAAAVGVSGCGVHCGTGRGSGWACCQGHGCGPRLWGGGQPGQRVEEQGTWASQKHSEAGYGRPVDRGVGTAQTAKQPRQQPAHPQSANYWAPLTRKRHTMPHPAQPQHTNDWAPRTRKRHQQEHRPQRPTERSNPTQHAKGRTGDCPGPRKGATTVRNVTQGAGRHWGWRDHHRHPCHCHGGGLVSSPYGPVSGTRPASSPRRSRPCGPERPVTVRGRKVRGRRRQVLAGHRRLIANRRRQSMRNRRPGGGCWQLSILRRRAVCVRCSLEVSLQAFRAPLTGSGTSFGLRGEGTRSVYHFCSREVLPNAESFSTDIFGVVQCTQSPCTPSLSIGRACRRSPWTVWTGEGGGHSAMAWPPCHNIVGRSSLPL